MFCKLDLECEQLHLQCIVVYKYIFIYNIEYMYTFLCGIIGPSHVGQNQYYNMCVYFTIHITVHVKKVCNKHVAVALENVTHVHCFSPTMYTAL